MYWEIHELVIIKNAHLERKFIRIEVCWCFLIQKYENATKVKAIAIESVSLIFEIIAFKNAYLFRMQHEINDEPLLMMTI